MSVSGERGPLTERDGEERLAAALAPFGWTCTADFWQRYYSDPWVFNLANAVERLWRQTEGDPTSIYHEAAALRAENERHRRANLVRAVIEGWTEEVDGSLTDYVNGHGWDAVPWRVAESALSGRGQEAPDGN